MAQESPWTGSSEVIASSWKVVEVGVTLKIRVDNNQLEGTVGGIPIMSPEPHPPTDLGPWRCQVSGDLFVLRLLKSLDTPIKTYIVAWNTAARPADIWVAEDHGL